MKNSLRFATLALALGICLALMQTPVASGEDLAARPAVDYRMAPLEQAKKIHRMAASRTGSDVTVTVMNPWCGDGSEDRSHLIVDEEMVSRSYLRRNLFHGPAHSISWSDSRNRTLGACDSKAECERKIEELCKGAGHQGARHLTVTVTVHSDGSKTCSGDCEGNGAVAFVTCNPR